MDAGVVIAAASVVVAVLGLLGALFKFTMDLSAKIGESINRIITVEQQLQEDRAHDRQKFSELYQFRDEAGKDLQGLTVKLDQITASLAEIREDIRELRNERAH